MARDRITLADISVRRTWEGIELAAMVDGYRKHRLYIGYTLREAKRDFRDVCNAKRKEN